VDKAGVVAKQELKRRELLRETGLPARDLRRIDPALSLTTSAPTLLVSDTVLLITLGQVRGARAAAARRARPRAPGALARAHGGGGSTRGATETLRRHVRRLTRARRPRSVIVSRDNALLFEPNTRVARNFLDGAAPLPLRSLPATAAPRAASRRCSRAYSRATRRSRAARTAQACSAGCRGPAWA